jgi:hypothetical protein
MDIKNEKGRGGLNSNVLCEFASLGLKHPSKSV